MLVLFENAAGYAVFKLLDEQKLQQSENLYLDFEDPNKASKIVKLKHFKKFKDTTEALAAATANVEGKMSKGLKKLMKKVIEQNNNEMLLVADAKLGQSIKEKFDLKCLTNNHVHELMRCIRSQMDSLIEGLPAKEVAAMSLGLAHSLSRYKLKFSPDKVDTMIVQAIALLDDLDKELNNYMMRCREWYGWHFPELAKIITDGVAYVKAVKLMRQRSNCSSTDFSAVLPEELEAEVKSAAEISMGTEVSEEDVNNITYLCDQVIEISEYRAQLFDYLRNRMLAIAPNLTVLVGELVGARLIAHAGSLINLAKHPSSTVQILGAEKALFRALKTKHDTPKYGLIYHATLITGSNPKLKGKVSRMLAAKAALAVRVDALGEDGDAELGIEHRAKVEARMRMLDEGVSRKLSGTGRSQKKWEKYENKSEVKLYNPSADSTIPRMKRMISEVDESSEKTPKKIKVEPGVVQEEPEEMETETPKSQKKKKKDKIKEEPEDEPEFKTPKSEKKKRKTDEADTTLESETPTSGKKKKKKKSEAEDVANSTLDTTIESETPKSGKKKKKKKVEQDSD